MRIWISTDLDGTLLDHDNYSYDDALPALNLCQAQGNPIVLNTSKTAAETIEIHTALGLRSPFVVENGSALIFPTSPQNNRVFGAVRGDILTFIKDARQRINARLVGFDDWTIEEIALQTGLNKDQAELAARKEYSEPFIWKGDAIGFARFNELAVAEGFQVLKGGRFYHLQGKSNKAAPLQWLKQNLKQFFPNLNGNEQLVCLGDNHNDVAMLNIADIPICVRSTTSDFPELDTSKPVIKTNGFGPIGWNQAVLDILNSFDQ